MTEVFFVLTVIYAVYVIYVVVSDKKKVKVIDDSAPAMMSVVHVDVKPLIPENITTQPLAKSVSKTVKPAATKLGLKNSETGEIVTNYGNYRFMKRWIKEALVSEGLLEKVYQNKEINTDVEVKIKEALARLESIERYQI